MKKMSLVITLVGLLTLTGCSDDSSNSKTRKSEESMFICIEKETYWKVVYHKETKVMYTISNGGYNEGNFTILVNPDGSPMIYKE